MRYDTRELQQNLGFLILASMDSRSTHTVLAEIAATNAEVLRLVGERRIRQR